MPVPDSRQAGTAEIIVTEGMVTAGLRQMHEYSYGEDIRYVLEAVFRAMAYESPQLPLPVQLSKPA